MFEINNAIEKTGTADISARKYLKFCERAKKEAHKIYAIRIDKNALNYAVFIAPGGVFQILDYDFFCSSEPNVRLSGQAKEILSADGLKAFVDQNELLEILVNRSKKHGGICISDMDFVQNFEDQDEGVSVLLMRVLINPSWQSVNYYLVTYAPTTGITLMKMDETTYKLSKWFVKNLVTEVEQKTPYDKIVAINSQDVNGIDPYICRNNTENRERESSPNEFSDNLMGSFDL